MDYGIIIEQLNSNNEKYMKKIESFDEAIKSYSQMVKNYEKEKKRLQKFVDANKEMIREIESEK